MPGGSRSLSGRPSLRHLKLVWETPERSHALDQLRWVIARFANADQPDWPAPDDAELNQHFDEHFLAALPPPALINTISGLAADLRGDLVVLGQTPVQAYIQLQGMHYLAVTETAPPYRLTGLRGLPVGSRPRGWQPRRHRGRDHPHPRSSDACRADHPPDPGQLHRNPPASGVDQPITRTGNT